MEKDEVYELGGKNNWARKAEGKWCKGGNGSQKEMLNKKEREIE